MKEEIREIPWTNGRYSVSNTGVVYSNYNTQGNKRKEPKIIHQKTVLGYKNVHLYINNQRVKYKVHRLVALAFIPNPYNLPQINHIDEDKSNNRADNLEWCNQSYNNNYGTHNKKVGLSLRGKPFGQFSDEGQLIHTFYTHREAAKHLGCTASKVCRILNGRSKNRLNLHYL